MILLDKVSKVFALEAGNFTALKENNLHIGKGEYVAIMGPSGSGKSTLLQLIGGLVLPTSGDITVDGVRLNDLNEKHRMLFRRTQVGFVFQNYQLLPMMTVEENIALPLAASKVPIEEIKVRVEQLLKDVNLEGRGSHLPSQLSGGQQQCVAIARALAMNPKLILADEPTGNLDRQTGEEVLQLLSRLNKDDQITIVMVTHDRLAAEKVDRIIIIWDGEVQDSPNGGDYSLIADFKPTHDDSMTKVDWVRIEGESIKPKPLVQDSNFDKTFEGKRVKLSIDQLVANKVVTLKFSISNAQTNEPITNLEPYLGSIGHVVIMTDDGEQYFHVHGEEGQGTGPNAIFETKFPKSGIYKIWGQFQHNNRVFTTSYVVNVP